MKIHSLSIRNFKCFQDLEMEFHPACNVLLGVNGVGKTSILEALRVAIGSLYLGLDKYENKIESPGITKDDIRIANLEQQYPTVVEVSGSLDSVAKSSLLPEEWKREVVTRGGKTLYKDAKEILEYSRRLQKCIREGLEVNLPLVAYFSTDRYKKERRESSIEPNGSRLRGYFNSLNPTTNIKFFLDLYFTETIDEIQRGKPSVLLATVNNAVKQCLQCEKIEYIVKEKELVMYYKDGNVMPFHLLSDGVRSTLSLVMEIAFRCYLLNPHLGVDAPKFTDGVVLIDEIDLHLHPSWQKHIVTDLRRAYPNMQFIVSTHAPLVLSSLNDCKIHSLEDGKVYDFPSQLGRDANYILKQMNVQYMDEESEKLLNQYISLIEKRSADEDLLCSMRSRLENLLGADNAQLKRADMLKSFFERL